MGKSILSLRTCPEISVGHRTMSDVKLTTSDVKSSYVWQHVHHVFVLKKLLFLSFLKMDCFFVSKISFWCNDTMYCINYSGFFAII